MSGVSLAFAIIWIARGCSKKLNIFTKMIVEKCGVKEIFSKTQTVFEITIASYAKCITPYNNMCRGIIGTLNTTHPFRASLLSSLAWFRVVFLSLYNNGLHVRIIYRWGLSVWLKGYMPHGKEKYHLMVVQWFPQGDAYSQDARFSRRP